MRPGTRRTLPIRPVAMRDTRRRRIHTVSFDPIEDDWVETIVGILAAEGYPTAARSEIVRVALLGLRETLPDASARTSPGSLFGVMRTAFSRRSRGRPDCRSTEPDHLKREVRTNVEYRVLKRSEAMLKQA